MKMAPQSKPFANAEPLRVHIVYAYPYELQPVNQAKTLSLFFSQSEARILQLQQKLKNYQK